MAYLVGISFVHPSYYEGEKDPLHIAYMYEPYEGKIVVRKTRYLAKKDDFASHFLSEEDKAALMDLLRDGLEEVTAYLKEGSVGLEAAPYRHVEVQLFDLPAQHLPDYLFNPDGNNLKDRYKDYPDLKARKVYSYFVQLAKFMAEKTGSELPVYPIPQKL